MAIDYDHRRNIHGMEGPRAAFAKLMETGRPASVLDLGCGIATWARAALDCGVKDVVAVDGIDIPSEQLLIPASLFRCFDLTQELDLGRTFDLVLCLEVAEHLEPQHADQLVANLVRHSDRIVFSAACPGQPGQHHVNCRWPPWWQQHFNAVGYVCNDEIRTKLWDEAVIEPWYRQNIFTALRDPKRASLEPRLRPMIHPDLFPAFSEAELVHRIERGLLPFSWYLSAPYKALAGKVRRKAQTLANS